MNETRHTRGPWHVGEGRLVGGPDRLFVADCSTSDRPAEEQVANMRLVAAAPELLAACKGALVYVKAVSGADWRVADLLRHIIAKAEGKS